MGFSLDKLSSFLFGAGTLMAFISMLTACILGGTYYNAYDLEPQKFTYGTPGDRFKCLLAVIILSIIGSVVLLAAFVLKLIGLRDLIITILNIAGFVFLLGTIIAEGIYLSKFAYSTNHYPKSYYCNNKAFKEHAEKVNPATCADPYQAGNSAETQIKANTTEIFKIQKFMRNDKLDIKSIRKNLINKAKINDDMSSQLIYLTIITYIVKPYLLAHPIPFIIKSSDKSKPLKETGTVSCYQIEKEIPESAFSGVAKCADENKAFFSDADSVKSSDIKVKGCSALNINFKCLGGISPSIMYKRFLHETKAGLKDEEEQAKIVENFDAEKAWYFENKDAEIMTFGYTTLAHIFQAYAVLIGAHIVCAIFVIVSVVLGFLKGHDDDKSLSSN